MMSTLPPSGVHLRLATLILEGIPPESVVDYSEEWSDKDLRDLSRAAAWKMHRRAVNHQHTPGPCGTSLPSTGESDRPAG
jgi:hypothetical protein